jgi:hypothetical protein
MLFHHKQRRSLELHAVKWIFQFGDKVNLRALRKMDEQRVQMMDGSGQVALQMEAPDEESYDQDGSMMDRSYQRLTNPEQGSEAAFGRQKKRTCWARLCGKSAK